MNASFFLHFLFCNLVLSILLVLIEGSRKLFAKHLTVKADYSIGFILFALLAFPFLPSSFFSFNPLGSLIAHFKELHYTSTAAINHSAPAAISPASTLWLQDFSTSVSRFSFEGLGKIFFTIWIIGLAVFTLLTLLANYKVYHLSKTSLVLKNPSTLEILESCKQVLNIKKPVKIYFSRQVATPITFGLFKARIILPYNALVHLSDKDLCYILYHELAHHKRKDLFVRTLISVFHILYWFNPIVWYSLQEFQMNIEVACDTTVLEIIGEKHLLDYGNTILNFIEQLSHTPFAIVSSIGGTKKQIKKRVLSITAFNTASRYFIFKSNCILGLILILVLSSTPLLSYSAQANHYDVSPSASIVQEDLSRFFEGYEGSFVLYDTKLQNYTIYNEEASKTRVSPVSTYKIYSGLIALDTKQISPEDSTLKWNGTTYSFDAWNNNQDLASALRNSVNWYFQTLDKKISLPVLQDYLTRIHYGNEDTSSGIDDYWLEASLKISPLEQVELLKSFYNYTLPFETEDIDAVKKGLLLASANNAALSGKTGSGIVNNKSTNGWFIGYVENDDNTYFFATNIHADDDATGNTATQITLAILKDKQIFYS